MSDLEAKEQCGVTGHEEDHSCQLFGYDPEKVQRRQKDVHLIEGLAPLFKVMGDETRLKILHALSEEDELCVCDVALIIGSSNATASHHLRLLLSMGLTKYRKEGKMAFYSLQSPHVRHLIREGMSIKQGL